MTATTKRRELTKTSVRWGVLWRTNAASIDGTREYIVGDYPRPTHCFTSRAQARAFIKERWGYIAARPDLRKAPHGWMIPIPVRVRVTVELAT